MTYTTSLQGQLLIQGFETCAKLRPDGLYQAYPDPESGGEPWTIGWGSTGPDIHASTIWSKAQCDARFQSFIANIEAHLNRELGGHPTTQSQFDALVSFAYNVGAHGEDTSTLLKKHLAGDFQGAMAEFSKWTYSAGHVSNGLVRRRAAEAAMYAEIDVIAPRA